ncbi:MAG: NAD(P)-dependent oxidoreductase [Candidatus Omnitrophica bacterium]|nr:NAD(P)-dependent oxidoreductase [Candidatus Omnitrophota bacterium]
MKVLLTGGAGYVGSVVAHDLLSRGHEVRVVDMLLYGGQGLLGLYQDERFSFLGGDLRSAQLVELALHGMDAVVHLAAIVGDPACARQPELARAVNLDASLQLFRASCAREVERFVFASTCSNYGRMSNPSVWLTEESELRPVSLYAQTKVEVEQAFLSPSAASRPVTTVLRFATVFGVSPRMRFDLTVNEFTMELLTKRKLTIYGAQFWRPYLHVRDAARAIGLVLESPLDKIANQAFNVGDANQNYQKGALAELIRAQIGNHARIERVEKTEDPRDYRVSFDKIQRGLGFQITRTVEQGVQELIEAISSGVITECDHSRYRN